MAGATRGAGRGIACMLGEAGATVYCTGRSSRVGSVSRPRSAGSPFDLTGRPETIEETAEMVIAYGGEGIPVQVDHTVEDQVKALFERVRAERGRLDVLVNDVWGGDALAADPDVSRKSGGVYSSWGLSEEYGFTDIDGRRPNWGKYFAEHVARPKR